MFDKKSLALSLLVILNLPVTVHAIKENRVLPYTAASGLAGAIVGGVFASGIGDTGNLTDKSVIGAWVGGLLTPVVSYYILNSLTPRSRLDQADKILTKVKDNQLVQNPSLMVQVGSKWQRVPVAIATPQDASVYLDRIHFNANSSEDSLLQAREVLIKQDDELLKADNLIAKAKRDATRGDLFVRVENQVNQLQALTVIVKNRLSVLANSPLFVQQRAEQRAILDKQRELEAKELHARAALKQAQAAEKRAIAEHKKANAQLLQAGLNAAERINDTAARTGILPNDRRN